MKKIYNAIKSFIEKHNWLARIISILMLVITCTPLFRQFAIIDIFCNFTFIFALLAVFRMFTSKYGSIPIIFRDAMLWTIKRDDLSEDEFEELYMSKSLERSALYFTIMLGFFALLLLGHLIVFAADGIHLLTSGGK